MMGCLPIVNSTTLGLTAMAGELLADARTGKNGRHDLIGMLRQSVFGRLAGYEDVTDAERLRHDPAMRWIVGGHGGAGLCGFAQTVGRFETHWLAAETNLSALADLSARWINLVHSRRPPRGIVLDMDSSVSPTHGEQEMSVRNGHYECMQPSVVRIQPVRRPGTLRSAPRQRPQRRRLGGCAQTGQPRTPALRRGRCSG
jgi:hypothetical protein